MSSGCKADPCVVLVAQSCVWRVYQECACGKPSKRMRCLAGLRTGKAHTSHANMMMATAAAIMLLAAAVTYELPHLVS